MIAPFGNGFCIVNEELFVTTATDKYSKVRELNGRSIYNTVYSFYVIPEVSSYEDISLLKLLFFDLCICFRLNPQSGCYGPLFSWKSDEET
jgi:hypothetical protein